MNFQEILSALKTIYGSYDSDSYDLGSGVHAFASSYYNNYFDTVGNFETAYTSEEVNQHTWYTVKYFKDHNIYIKVTGYYSSYNDNDGLEFYDGWDSCTEVSPVTKTVTTFE